MAATSPSVRLRAAVASDIAYHHQCVNVELMNNAIESVCGVLVGAREILGMDATCASLSQGRCGQGRDSSKIMTDYIHYIIELGKIKHFKVFVPIFCLF